MLESVQSWVTTALGLSESSLNLSANEMIIRAVIVYFFTLLVVRFGHKRLLGHFTAFDIVLGIILGSVVSRAITGSAAFFPTLAAGLTLVLLHWLVAALAFRSHSLGALVKGRPQVLVTDGEIDWNHMRSSHITEHDLHQAIRERANLTDLDEVVTAQLERSGSISVISKKQPAQIVEVSVEDGVQTIRIHLN